MKTRNLKTYGIIYKITNLINNKIYIGQTVQEGGFDSRYHGNILNTHNIHLKRSILKYGNENFEIEKEFDVGYSQTELDNKEIYWINTYNTLDNRYGYNKKEGGNNGKLTEETKIKIRLAVQGKQRGKLHHMYGKKHSQETIDKIKISTSLSLSGEKHPMYGKHWDEKVKDEIRISLKEYFKIHNNSNKGKKFESYSGVKHPNATMIICLTTGEIFDYIELAKEKYHTNDIGRACKGKLKSTGKHPITGERLKWMYYSDYIKQQLIHNENLGQVI